MTARQSKTMSAVESVTNIAFGMGIAFTGQLIIFPALGIPVSLDENVKIMLFFTVVSFVRSYVLRRVFSNMKSGKARNV